MRKLIIVFFLLWFVGCSQQYYQTREGRIKQNYYNSVQFNNKEQKQKYQKRYDRILKKKRK